MKIFFLMCSLLAYSFSAMAFQENQTNINAGLGIFGSRGILGVSIDRFIYDEHQALSASLGFDFIGVTSTLGYKYFSEKKPTTNSAWDKCFFFIECETYLYAGAGLQYASATSVKITENGSERNYTTDPKFLGMASVGARNVFKNNLTLDLEFSYRSILFGGRATQTAGLAADDTKSLELGYRAFGMNVGLGYLF